LSREFLDPVVNRFTQQIISTEQRELFLWIYFASSHFAHNRTLLFSSVLLKHGRHFDYWNEPLHICMCICYLKCHDDELCCYLVTHRKPTKSITIVLLPFITYLLTLPRTQWEDPWFVLLS
jgi:hypothetical protein